jgi:endonuclease/exonuclease/phosphatase (EEP) superfamily protein YafD
VKVLTLVICALSLLLVGLTLLPLVRSARWWIRVWDYPRLQLATALIALLIAQGVLAYTGHDVAVNELLMIATAAAALWQLFRIWPYTPAHRLQSLAAEGAGADKDKNGISVLVTNVLQDNRNARGLLEIVRSIDPDILIAVETDAWWDAQFDLLTERYPFNVRVPQENTYGMHVFSALELKDVRVRNLVTHDIPSVRATVRLRSGEEIDLYAVHPEPPLPHKDVEERDAELLLVAREVKERGRTALVAGDLNDVAWSHTTRLFQRLSGLLDPRVGRGLFATFHTGHWIMRWPLDHLFHDVRFRLREIRVLPDYGSDHFPIYAALVFNPEAARHAEKPKPQGDDREEAREKIAEGKAAGAVKG